MHDRIRRNKYIVFFNCPHEYQPTFHLFQLQKQRAKTTTINHEKAFRMINPIVHYSQYIPLRSTICEGWHFTICEGWHFTICEGLNFTRMWKTLTWRHHFTKRRGPIKLAQHRHLLYWSACHKQWKWAVVYKFEQLKNLKTKNSTLSDLLKHLILKIKETETKSDIKDQRNKCRIDTLNSFIHDRSLSCILNKQIYDCSLSFIPNKYTTTHFPVSLTNKQESEWSRICLLGIQESERSCICLLNTRPLTFLYP
jgi:hypothetical protein